MSFAEGGFNPSKDGIKFSEPETGWEWYISGRPGNVERTRRIWEQARRLLDGSGDERD